MGKLALRTIQITGGRIIDPSQDIDQIGDLWISRGRILPLGRGLRGGRDRHRRPRADRLPGPDRRPRPPPRAGQRGGRDDRHRRRGRPGRRRDLGRLHAQHDPAIDTQAAAEFVVLQGQRARQANVYPVGAVSKGRKGEELAELGQLVAGGAVAFTDDGAPVASAALMRRALEYSKMFDRVIMQHCQVPELTVGGVMNEGFESMRLGLAGMPAAAEDIMVARDIRLAEITGGRLHIQHISTARSVELVREGKRRGVRVTAEACPHHFTLTDERLRTFDSNYKMNPPLRTWSDVEAVIGGLKDGTIEILATDHAPHAPEKKMRELDQAPFGIIGLETLIPITVTQPDRARPPDLARGRSAS